MKKAYIFTAVLLALTLSASSCVKDFLDVKPRGKEIATDIKHFRGILNSATIISVTGNLVYGYMGEELSNTQQSLEQLQTKQKDPGMYAFQFKADPFDGEVESAEWSNSYAKIYQYNFVINNVMDAEGATEAEKLAIQSEARVQRAYLHFLASMFFSKPYNAATAANDLSVPIVTKPDTQGSDGYQRATVKELYEWVIKEMKESLPNIPDSYGVTRCYSAAANCLLGRVYWYMGDYANALTYLREGYAKLKAEPKYHLLSYRDNVTAWKGAKTFFNSYPDPYKNSEVITLRYATQTDLTSDTALPVAYIKPEYVAMYKDGDLRKDHLTTYAATGGYRPAGRKYFNTVLDLPEVYFMLAECEARAGSEADARSLMLDYRKSRFADDASAAIPAEAATSNDLIKFIVNEHILEYPGRGASVIDMKRLWDDPLFQDKKDAYVHPVTGGETYTMDKSAMLTWKIPNPVMKFHSDWKDN